MYRLVTFTADATTTELATCHKPAGDRPSYLATVTVYGTFGGGTVTLFMSPNGGTNKDIPLIDPLTGSAYSLTSARTFNIELGTGNGSAGNTDIKIYATLSGSTSPALNISIHDNLG